MLALRLKGISMEKETKIDATTNLQAVVALDMIGGDQALIHTFIERIEH